MILWGLGLKLFNITKDTVFAEIVVSSNIFGFLVVDWTPKWIKSANLGCVPFKPKLRILKNFSNNVFFLLETTCGRNCNKVKQYLGV